jgi:uncharacterized protein YqfB (UPF0267 family)
MPETSALSATSKRFSDQVLAGRKKSARDKGDPAFSVATVAEVSESEGDVEDWEDFDGVDVAVLVLSGPGSV